MIRRIFLIDDDADDAEIFGTALQEADSACEFHYLNDSKRATDLLSQQKIPVPAFIFLDINMPLLNGLDCLRKLKSVDFLRQIPVLMYSTSYSAHDIETVLHLGAIAFWTKPRRYRDLLLKLQELLKTEKPDPNAMAMETFRSQTVQKKQSQLLTEVLNNEA